jgi:regulator of sigma E protease
MIKLSLLSVFSMTYIIAFLISLTIIVFFHELGHFYFARKYGVQVDIFSIGFGPEIWGKTDSKGTRWRISALPFGGYVQMLGDADPTSKPDQEAIEALPLNLKDKTLASKTVWQRIAISFGGPLANFIVAFCILMPVLLFKGEPGNVPVVEHVIDGSPSAEAGLKTGDIIQSVNGRAIETLLDLKLILSNPLPSNEITLGILENDGQTRTAITHLNDQFKTSLGFKPALVYTYKPCTFLQSIYRPIEMMGAFCINTFKGLGEMIMGNRSSKELGGIISIGHMAGKSLDVGLISFVIFMAILSMNLGFINLFPVPGLDGGHLIIYFIEAIRGKPLPLKAQEFLFRMGFILVISLMLYTTWNDVVHFIIKRFV